MTPFTFAITVQLLARQMTPFWLGVKLSVIGFTNMICLNMWLHVSIPFKLYNEFFESRSSEFK